jgi:hypothetical protein
MNFTFGSVGDIIAICGLIKALVDTLSESKGSSAKFQALVQHLGNLEAGLRELEDLSQVCARVGGYESLGRRARFEAFSCRQPIEQFKSSIDKYRLSLRYGGSGNQAKDLYWKIRFAIAHKDEVETFQQYIRDRLQVISIIIITAKA